MSKFFILILILTFTASCGSTKDAFKLKKKSSADEFLVEKKNPLVLPPNYGQLPQPASGQIINENSKEDDEEFKSYREPLLTTPLRDSLLTSNHPKMQRQESYIQWKGSRFS